MALRDLLTALEEEGAAEHEKAQQDRRRQAAQLLADARQRATTIHADVVTAAETAARQEAENLLITARFGARRAARTARDDALEEVLGQVREQLLALPGSPEGPTMAAACLQEAVTAMPQQCKGRLALSLVEHCLTSKEMLSYFSVGRVSAFFLERGRQIVGERRGRRTPTPRRPRSAWCPSARA